MIDEQGRAGPPALRFLTLPAERITALVSTRNGGVSTERFDSLNLGLRVGDDPAAVLENRRRFFEAWDLPLTRSVWCRQVHADRVVLVDDEVVARRPDGTQDRGAFDESTIVPDADALITDLVGVPLCVTLADCVPVVIYDERAHAIGLAHAGWGGTVARIASTTVAAMENRFGSVPEALQAAIGPSISPERYEVGPDVYERAQAAYPQNTSSVLQPDGKGQWRFDLWQANVIDLISAGLARSAIEVSAESTIDQLDRFYSHRAEATSAKQTGRMACVAMLR